MSAFCLLEVYLHKYEKSDTHEASFKICLQLVVPNFYASDHNDKSWFHIKMVNMSTKQ